MNIKNKLDTELQALTVDERLARKIQLTAKGGGAQKKRRSGFAAAGIAVAACAVLAVLVLPALIGQRGVVLTPRTGDETDLVLSENPATPDPLLEGDDVLETEAPVEDEATPEPDNEPALDFPSNWQSANTDIQGTTRIVAHSDGYLYYSNPADGRKLYRIREDGTEKTKLSDKEGIMELTLTGNRIYFTSVFLPADDAVAVNPDENYSVAQICRISTDGSGENVLYQAKEQGQSRLLFDLIVEGNSIYFNEREVAYKMDLDGANVTRIAAANLLRTDVRDGYLYTDGSAGAGTTDWDWKLHRIAVDSGEDKIIASEDFISDRFLIRDGWIYYTGATYTDKKTGEVKNATDYSGDGDMMANANETFDFYKVRVDGTEKTKLLENKEIEQFVVSGDWIYYVYGDARSPASIYKMKTDGSENQLLLKGKYFLFGIADEWLYIGSSYNNPRLYKLHTDGGDPQELKIFGA